jgi:hypothetical protein
VGKIIVKLLKKKKIMRKITVIHGSGNSFTIETTATTFGGLKPILENNGLNLSQLKCVMIKDGFSEIDLISSSDDLFEGNFKIYTFSTKKVASAISIDEIKNKLSFPELRRLAKEAVGFAPNNKQECIDKLVAHYSVKNASKKTKDVRKAEIKEQACTSIEEILIKIAEQNEAILQQVKLLNLKLRS